MQELRKEKSTAAGEGGPRRRITVRTAGPRDLEAVLAFVEEAHGESRYAAYPFGKVRLHRYMAQMLKDEEGVRARIFFVEEEGVPVGMVAANAGPLLFSPVMQVSVVLFFVRRKARFGPAPQRLLEALTGWAKALEAVEIAVHVTRGEEEGAERINRFFRAKGFECSGENLHLRLG